MSSQEKMAFAVKKFREKPTAACWTCAKHHWKYAPYPCKNRKRFQDEGVCLDKVVSEDAQKIQDVLDGKLDKFNVTQKQVDVFAKKTNRFKMGGVS
jgi:hypothetical protein